MYFGHKTFHDYYMANSTFGYAYYQVTEEQAYQKFMRSVEMVTRMNPNTGTSTQTSALAFIRAMRQKEPTVRYRRDWYFEVPEALAKLSPEDLRFVQDDSLWRT